MTSHSHKSPRAAIRDWLSHTVDGTVEQLGLEIAQNNESEKRTRNVKHKVRRKKDGIHQNYLQSSTCPRPKQDTNHEKAHVSSGPAADFQDSPRLADRFGLRAPFHNFPTQERQSKTRPSDLDRKRKWKPSRSSSSSDLERAVFPEIEESSSSPKLGTATAQHRPKRQQNLHPNIADPSKSNAVIVSPRRPKESYERKKRHKTRKDRYELKQDMKARKETEARKKTANKKKERHQRRVVSGTALMQEFSAKNVAPDRLTVRK
ncbi:MAG: hypothetical protein Q9214_005245 [Letrouitia sp. 1 TL-2023]